MQNEILRKVTPELVWSQILGDDTDVQTKLTPSVARVQLAKDMGHAVARSP